MARREASRWTHQSFEDVKVAVSAFLALKNTWEARCQRGPPIDMYTTTGPYLSQVRTLTLDVELLITSNLSGCVFDRNVQSMSAATVASSTEASITERMIAMYDSGQGDKK